MTHSILQNRMSQQRHRTKIKKELFDFFNNKCNKCGYIGLALQIDHVNGGGCKEIREIKSHHKDYYSYILKKIKAGSKDYQCLCANCNWEKKFNNKEVKTMTPHNP